MFRDSLLFNLKPLLAILYTSLGNPFAFLDLSFPAGEAGEIRQRVFDLPGAGFQPIV
jgi:hypothetical protein